MVDAVGHAVKDPDIYISTWLRDGAPMGLNRRIDASGLLPLVEEAPLLTVEALDRLPRSAKNHPSFTELHGLERPPGVDQIQSQVDAGFAAIYESQEEAERHLGGLTHPTPLGTVTKVKPDGSLKHRVIQDLRANRVNDAVHLPERQVLPRGLDHGVDLAVLADDCHEKERVATLVLDFRDAFNSVPLHPSERRFNCARSGGRVSRTRPPLYEGEPSSGSFVVWQVLGFGG